MNMKLVATVACVAGVITIGGAAYKVTVDNAAARDAQAHAAQVQADTAKRRADLAQRREDERRRQQQAEAAAKWKTESYRRSRQQRFLNFRSTIERSIREEYAKDDTPADDVGCQVSGRREYRCIAEWTDSVGVSHADTITATVDLRTNRFIWEEG
jgi:hypothetical protein